MQNCLVPADGGLICSLQRFFTIRDPSLGKLGGRSESAAKGHKNCHCRPSSGNYSSQTRLGILSLISDKQGSSSGTAGRITSPVKCLKLRREVRLRGRCSDQESHDYPLKPIKNISSLKRKTSDCKAFPLHKKKLELDLGNDRLK
ncbi:hypothetical protein Q3G72_033389 [Acer saccharum]|nr:hypothetical protein Q3G72_033389 [Acer saccharum]